MENKPILEDQPNNKPQPNKAKPKPRPKPLVEGINAPRNTNDIVFVRPTLTAQENKLIKEIDQPKVQEPNEPKLLPKSVINRINQSQSSPGMGRVLYLVIILILAGAGYFIYTMYFNQTPTPTQTEQDRPFSQEEVAMPRGSDAIPDVISPAPVMGTSTPPVATTTPPVKKELKLKINATPTSFLNVRNGPSLSNKIIVQVHPGEVYTYTEKQSDWYKIILPNNTTGWVSGQYITIQ